MRGVAPGFLLLPAQDYSWELKQQVEIRIPLSGSVKEVIGNRDLDAGVAIAGEDDFSIFEDNVFQIWEVVRILFAGAKYPDLSSDECLNVVALELDGEELIVYGQIIRSVS